MLLLPFNRLACPLQLPCASSWISSPHLAELFGFMGSAVRGTSRLYLVSASCGEAWIVSIRAGSRYTNIYAQNGTLGIALRLCFWSKDRSGISINAGDRWMILFDIWLGINIGYMEGHLVLLTLSDFIGNFRVKDEKICEINKAERKSETVTGPMHLQEYSRQSQAASHNHPRSVKFIDLGSEMNPSRQSGSPQGNRQSVVGTKEESTQRLGREEEIRIYLGMDVKDRATLPTAYGIESRS
ncbi:hypothetical protein SISNIDRAFT_470314 [Sistotremastrum niveocremeum HHB9708]|uniref:Uncharacterized protein n=1 Tax=Sistotremastrum niveocremeum HHB9708 TaxID=1314777 RepID=A0A164P3I2_9AGAM|nr:hypothetical protein SISNIDRAFT_470314 [Sistotremastrum niveocremeum HHB9708]